MGLREMARRPKPRAHLHALNTFKILISSRARQRVPFPFTTVKMDPLFRLTDNPHS
jgi:hypothetical protein